MRQVLTVAVATMLIGCGTGFAQVGPTPGMGPTSPVGALNFNVPSGPVGIPLGATQVDTGGVSPITGTPSCSGAAGSSSTFDGGGTMSGSAMGSTCGVGATIGSPNMAVTSSSAAALGSTNGANTIPLGATELGTPGESTFAGISTAPCSGAATGTTGATLSNGC